MTGCTLVHGFDPEQGAALARGSVAPTIQGSTNPSNLGCGQVWVQVVEFGDLFLSFGGITMGSQNTQVLGFRISGFRLCFRL